MKKQPILILCGILFSRFALFLIFHKTKVKTILPTPKSSAFWRVMVCSRWKENKYALIKLKRNFSTANEKPRPRLFPFASLFSLLTWKLFLLLEPACKGVGEEEDRQELEGNCWNVQFQEDLLSPQPFWVGFIFNLWDLGERNRNKRAKDKGGELVNGTTLQSESLWGKEREKHTGRGEAECSKLGLYSCSCCLF